MAPLNRPVRLPTDHSGLDPNVAVLVESMAQVREDLGDLREDVQSQITGLRSDIRDQLNTILAQQATHASRAERAEVQVHALDKAVAVRFAAIDSSLATIRFALFAVGALASAASALVAAITFGMKL